MRKLILYIATSLDGYIARRDHGLDWLPPIDEGFHASYDPFIATIDVILMGRKTYDVCNAMEPWPYTQDVIVFTKERGKYNDDRVTFTSEDPVEALSRLRSEEGKDIWLMGGGELIRTFHEAGLIDEYVIAVIPVTIGDGIPLFVRSERTVRLKMSAIKQYKDFVELKFGRG